MTAERASAFHSSTPSNVVPTPHACALVCVWGIGELQADGRCPCPQERSDPLPERRPQATSLRVPSFDRRNLRRKGVLWLVTQITHETVEIVHGERVEARKST